MSAMEASSYEDELPWNQSLFARIPSGKKDFWLVLDHWVVRAHPCDRVQPFHPLHASFPLDSSKGEAIHSDRVTITFLADAGEKPVVTQDSWHASPTQHTRAMWKNHGKWKGYTFFRRNIQEKENSDPANEAQLQQTTQDVEEASEEFAHMSVGTMLGYARPGGAKARGIAACALKSSTPEEPEDGEFELVEDQ